MNYNTMFKKICIGLFAGMFVMFYAKPVFAETTVIPDGDILVVYSDAASDAAVDAVADIVEILTYQAFQVSYGTASQCSFELQRFDYIICYDIERYPSDFIEKLSAQETMGGKILIMGSQFMRDYQDYVGKGNSYMTDDKQVGKMTYFFDSLTDRVGLVEEEEFLFLTKDIDSQAGTLEIGTTHGYIIATAGNITHMAVSNMDNNLVKAIFSKEVAYWKWEYDGEPHVYAQYIVLNEVYPFQDPEKLLEIVDLMISMQEPFVISVMPVYVNGEYPAMQRFCEILRYAQANGGAVIIHGPINQMNEIDSELIDEYMTMAIRYYVNQGVYPLALQVPSAWMHDEETIEILSNFGTVFTTNEEDDLVEFSKDAHTNTVYADGHQWVGPTVALDYVGVSYTKVYSTAVYIGMEEDLNVIEDKIDACRNSFVPLKSLWDIEHSFWTDEDRMTYKDGVITLNEERTEKTFYATEYATEYDYHRNMLKRFSKDLTEENRKLVVAVLVVSSIFILFLLIARYQNKRKFFIKKDKE